MIPVMNGSYCWFCFGVVSGFGLLCPSVHMWIGGGAGVLVSSFGTPPTLGSLNGKDILKICDPIPNTCSIVWEELHF